MTDDENFCRKCLLIESGKENIMEDIRQRIEKILPKEKTPESAYENRLTICKNCDFLVGGTCLKCGCYPEFRAAFIKNKCPVNLWQNERTKQN